MDSEKVAANQAGFNFRRNSPTPANAKPREKRVMPLSGIELILLEEICLVEAKDIFSVNIAKPLAAGFCME